MKGAPVLTAFSKASSTHQGDSAFKKHVIMTTHVQGLTIHALTCNWLLGCMRQHLSFHKLHDMQIPDGIIKLLRPVGGTNDNNALTAAIHAIKLHQKLCLESPTGLMLA